MTPCLAIMGYRGDYVPSVYVAEPPRARWVPHPKRTPKMCPGCCMPFLSRHGEQECCSQDCARRMRALRRQTTWGYR